MIIGRHCVSSLSVEFKEYILLDAFPSAAIPTIEGGWVVSSAASISTIQHFKRTKRKNKINGSNKKVFQLSYLRCSN